MNNLKKKIQELKNELLKIDEFLPGTLVEMYVESKQKGGETSSENHLNTNSKKRSNSTTKHGPYYQVSYSIGPQNKSMYVRKKDLPVIQKRLSQYQRFKSLLDELLQTQIEHTKQELKEATHEQKPKKTRRLPSS